MGLPFSSGSTEVIGDDQRDQDKDGDHHERPLIARHQCQDLAAVQHQQGAVIAKCAPRATITAIMKDTGGIAATPAAIVATMNGIGVNALAMMNQNPQSWTRR